MEIFGWIVLFLITMVFTIWSLGVVVLSSKFYGNLGFESLAVLIISALLWWATFSFSPFHITLM